MAEEPQGPDSQEEPEADTDEQQLPSWAQEQLAKARREAASYRTRLREAEPLAKRAKELEDAQKTEAEKLNERLTGTERRATEAELAALRYEVALDLGLTRAQAKWLVGATKEELEADARELLDSFKGEASPVPRRPLERLRSAGEGNDPPPAKGMNSFLAEAIKAKRG